MEDYYEYLDSNGVTTLYKLIKDDTVALIDSYSVTINGITTTLDTHINDSDIHTPISDIESMVDTKISGLVNSAPETLDTLKELSDALGADPNFATTVANQIGNKANKDSVYTKEETDTLLEGKANSVHSHVVSDITDFPTIPTKTSELSNDSNFVTSTELHDYATKNDLNSKQDALSEEQLSNIDSIPDKANKSDLSTVATSGSYKDLLDKPVIPEGADLSDYYNKGETDNLLNSKANTSDLAVVAKSGNYNDLNNTPAIPTKLSQLENDMGFGSGSGGVITSISWTNITDKPNFATVATSGSYNDLSNKPTIPKVYNKTLTIQKNGTNVATFTSNSNTDVTANITVPTKTSDLTNDSGFITGISWDKVTNKPTLAKVATSGSYTDLSNTPTIPTKVSQLENDTGFINTLTDVVDTKSNQTINGIKTFTNGPLVTNNGTTIGFSIKNTAIGRGEVPSEIYHNTFRVYDKNTKIMGEFCVEKSNSGSTLAQINVRSEDANGKQISRSVYFNMSNDGTKTSFYPNVTNDIDLGMSQYKWANVYATNAYINNTYTNRVTTYSITHPTDDSYFFMSGGSDYNKGATLYLGGVSATNFTPGRFALAARKTDGSSIELAGSPDGTLLWNGKNVAIDENLVHRSGDESISGTKMFLNDIFRKNTSADLTVTPTGYTNTNIIFADKNNKTLAHIEYVQRPSGVNDVGIFAWDKNGVAHGIHINTNNEVIPLMSSSESYSLGSATYKWGKIYSNDVVHTSGNEYIHGTKIFSGIIHRYADLTTSGDAQVYRFDDINDNYCGHIYNNVHRQDNAIANGPGAYNAKSGKIMELEIASNDAGVGMVYVAGTAIQGNVETVTSSTDYPGLATMGWVNNPATSTNVVHRTGNETVNGVKSFNNLMYIYDNMSNKNSRMDLFTTPANTLYSHYMFVDKNNEVSAYMQYGQQNTGTDFIGLFIHDKNRALHGIQVTTNNEVIPISNNTYSLGSSGLKWGNVYATTFNGAVHSTIGNAFMAQNSSYTFLIRNDGSNTYFLMSDKDGVPGTWSTARPLIINNATGVCSINGNANSATYAETASYSPTPATTDNSTRIATTAWVRTYVDSVAGSSAVGSSISAYYSNAIILTATKTSNIGTGLFPAVYSDYINIAPTVGTIYTGSQLFSSLTPTAYGTKSIHVYQTTASAEATFSGAFSPSAKYLCTTANAVRFRAYVSQGTNSDIGTASVVDNSSTKSIFIRVQ